MSEKSERFDKLVEDRFVEQADLNERYDTDSVFDKELSFDRLKITEEHGTLVNEKKYWESVRETAVKNKLSLEKIGKISQKISSLVFKISDLEEQLSKHDEKPENIEAIEKEIQELEEERANISSKLDVLYAKLQGVKPDAPTLNNPKKIDEFDDEREYLEILESINKRRKAGQEAGEFNTEGMSSGVKIKHPL